MGLNDNFLRVLTQSFLKYIEFGARSNEKLKILHSFIANAIKNRLNDEHFSLYALGINAEREIRGRYIDKRVDIAIEKDGQILAGVAVKFVMSNYSQNSNNYFENMLGETANLRSNGIPYFQILILPSNAPYFENNGTISKIEQLSEHHLQKYLTLSSDNIDTMLHSPNKTLLCVVDFPQNAEISTKAQYLEYCRDVLMVNHLRFSSNFNYIFQNAVIYNDFERFIDKICHFILAI